MHLMSFLQEAVLLDSLIPSSSPILAIQSPMSTPLALVKMVGLVLEEQAPLSIEQKQGGSHKTPHPRTIFKYAFT